MRHFAISLVVLLIVSAPAASQAGSFSVGGLEFEQPEAWETRPLSSPMRKAHLVVPSTNGASADVIFFYFGPDQGGSAQDNVDRWISQFQEPPDTLKPVVASESIEGTRVTFVRATGTFLSGMPGGPTTPQPDHSLHGAIIEGPQGHVFIKMTGPVSLVTSARDPFRAMIRSALD